MLWTWVRRQDLNEDAPHPSGIGVHLFLLLLLLIIIFINFFCISSHRCAKNGKTNPTAHNFIAPHLPSSSGGSECKWKRCSLPRNRHNPSCSSRSLCPLPQDSWQWCQQCPQPWDRQGTPGAASDSEEEISKGETGRNRVEKWEGEDKTGCGNYSRHRTSSPAKMKGEKKEMPG